MFLILQVRRWKPRLNHLPKDARLGCGRFQCSFHSLHPPESTGGPQCLYHNEPHTGPHRPWKLQCFCGGAYLYCCSWHGLIGWFVLKWLRTMGSCYGLRAVPEHEVFRQELRQIYLLPRLNKQRGRRIFSWSRDHSLLPPMQQSKELITR